MELVFGTMESSRNILIFLDFSFHLTKQPVEMNAWKSKVLGNFIVVKWLRLSAFNARGCGSIPGLWTRILMLHKLAEKYNILEFCWQFLFNYNTIKLFGLFI